MTALQHVGCIPTVLYHLLHPEIFLSGSKYFPLLAEKSSNSHTSLLEPSKERTSISSSKTISQHRLPSLHVFSHGSGDVAISRVHAHTNVSSITIAIFSYHYSFHYYHYSYHYYHYHYYHYHYHYHYHYSYYHYRFTNKYSGRVA